MSQISRKKNQQKSLSSSDEEIKVNLGVLNTMEKEKTLHLKIIKSEGKNGSRSKKS